METPVPIPVVTLCILNIFFKSYFQHLHHKSCMNQPLEQGLGSRCLCPSGNVPTTRLCCHTHCFSLFTTYIFHLFVQNEADSSSRFSRLTKYSMDGNLKHSWRTRGICYPALLPYFVAGDFGKLLHVLTTCLWDRVSQGIQVEEPCLRILPGTN